MTPEATSAQIFVRAWGAPFCKPSYAAFIRICGADTALASYVIYGREEEGGCEFRGTITATIAALRLLASLGVPASVKIELHTTAPHFRDALKKSGKGDTTRFATRWKRLEAALEGRAVSVSFSKADARREFAIAAAYGKETERSLCVLSVGELRTSLDMRDVVSSFPDYFPEGGG